MKPGSNRVNHILTCKCGGALTAVTDSRPEHLKDIPVIKRKRLCASCGKRQSTFELTEGSILGFQSHRQKRIARTASGISDSVTSLVAMLSGDGNLGDEDDGI